MWAGRPFFMTIGVSQASAASLSSSAVRTEGQTRRVQVVDVRLEHHHERLVEALIATWPSCRVPGRRRMLVSTRGPGSPRPHGRRWPCRRRPWCPPRRPRLRPPSSAAGPASSPTSSAERPRRRRELPLAHRLDDPASGRPRTAGTGTATSPWEPRTDPEPTAIALTTTSDTPRSSSAAHTPTTSAMESHAPTSWKLHLVDLDAVHPRLDACERLERRVGPSPNGVRQVSGGEELLDLRPRDGGAGPVV